MFRNSKFKKERGKKRKNWEMEYSTDREESRVHVSELSIPNVSDYLNLIHRSLVLPGDTKNGTMDPGMFCAKSGRMFR